MSVRVHNPHRVVRVLQVENVKLQYFGFDVIVFFVLDCRVINHGFVNKRHFSEKNYIYRNILIFEID
jgi:hypothetical protein